ncbi:MAG: hypothetical protein SGILL_008874, partial [Bacillariaceae sp.]
NAPSDDLLNPDKLLEGAKQLGRDISVQFDALMKMAIEGSGEMKEIVSGAMAPIPEEGARAMLDLEKPVEITTKKHKQIGASTYQVPMSQSFESDPLADAMVPLPPHQPQDSRWVGILVGERLLSSILREEESGRVSNEVPWFEAELYSNFSALKIHANVHSLDQTSGTFNSAHPSGQVRR